MKKLGFTLSELLISLGVIGVVSALTLPTLFSDTTSAQIGPKLVKAAAAFEQANQAMLSANSSDSITDARLDVPAEYADNITRYFKATATVNGRNVLLTSKDGFNYTVQIRAANIDTTEPAHQQRIGDVDIQTDLRAVQVPALNLFRFSLWNDGSLRPMGGTGWDRNPASIIGGAGHWTTNCPRAEDGNVSNAQFCAGHIFENNSKVLYRLP